MDQGHAQIYERRDIVRTQLTGGSIVLGRGRDVAPCRKHAGQRVMRVGIAGIQLQRRLPMPHGLINLVAGH